MTDHIIKAAKAAGGTTYTNRHHNGTACAFGPEALKAFWDAAYRRGMERAARVCEDKIAGINDARDWARGDCAAAIRAHAQNQPKNVHDGSVV